MTTSIRNRFDCGSSQHDTWWCAKRRQTAPRASWIWRVRTRKYLSGRYRLVPTI